MTDNTELKRLAEAATPGPWISGGNWVSTQKGVRSVAECSRGDEKYIAAANPAAVLDLIAENARLKDWGKANGDLAQTAMDKLWAANHERDELRAEVAGLKTGYEAYERVNAELKAEVARSSEREILQLAEIEALRNAFRPLLAHWDDLKAGESLNVDAARAALGQGEQS